MHPSSKGTLSRHTLAKLEQKLRLNFIPFTRLVQLKLNSMRIAMFWLTIRTILTLQKTSSSIRLFLVRVSITRANKQKIERRHSVYPAFIFKSRQFWANFFPKMFTSNLFPASIFPCYHTRFFRIHLNTHIIFIDPYTIFVLLSWKKPSICAFRLQNIYNWDCVDGKKCNHTHILNITFSAHVHGLSSHTWRCDIFCILFGYETVYINNNLRKSNIVAQSVRVSVRN